MMNSTMLRFPDVPTTPEQWAAIAWLAIILFAAIGLAGLYFSWNPPADKADLALRLRTYSFAFLGLAAGIYAFKRFVRALVN